MKHTIIPGALAFTVDPRKAVDPFAPGGIASDHLLGPTHEDPAGGPLVLLENVKAQVIGGIPPWLLFTAISYSREAPKAWRGGFLANGLRPLVSYQQADTGENKRFGSQSELAFRYGSFCPDIDENDEARRRADELLCECLNPLQRLTWKWGRIFYVRGQVNTLYRIEHGNGAQIVDPYTHDTHVSLCYHPETYMPNADVALATKLLIDSGPEGEELLLQTARTTVKPARRRRPEPQLGRELWAMERELLV